MNSPALKLILSFKITCILRSPVRQVRCPGLEKTEHGEDLSYFDYSFLFLYIMKEHTCIKTLLIMKWMMLLLVYYIALLWYCTWRPPPQNVSAILGFGVWQRVVHTTRWVEDKTCLILIIHFIVVHYERTHMY